MNKGSDFSLIGTDEAIMLNGKLTEFLESSNAKITKITYYKKLEYNDTYGIINCVEKEIIGHVEVTQRDNKRYYKMFCDNSNSSDMTEFIDFENAFLD